MPIAPAAAQTAPAKQTPRPHLSDTPISSALIVVQGCQDLMSESKMSKDKMSQKFAGKFLIHFTSST
jgi:hypothetical protein